jgi:hypothetical protein
MKRLKTVDIILITLIMGLNGCGSGGTKSGGGVSYLDSNLSKGMMTKKILEDKGLYSFQLFNYDRLNLEIFHNKLDIDKLVTINTTYSFNGDKFIKTNRNRNMSMGNSVMEIRQLTDNGWESIVKKINENDKNITFNKDGYFSKNAKTIILSIDKLEGLAIKSKVNNKFPNMEEIKIRDFILKDTLFSKDTFLVRSKTEYLFDSNISILDRHCFARNSSEKEIDDMECEEDISKKFYNATPLSFPSPTPSISPLSSKIFMKTNQSCFCESDESCYCSIDENIDNSMTFSSIEEFLVYFKKDGEHFLSNYPYSNQFDENGTIYYFEEMNNYKQKELTGKLKLQTLHEVEFYEINTPSKYRNNFPQNSENFYNGERSDILIELDGTLQRGTWQKSSGWSIEKEYNNEAINDIKKAIETFMKEGSSDIE